MNTRSKSDNYADMQLEFYHQPIVDEIGSKHDWVELLARPKVNQMPIGLDVFFGAMSDNEKVDFDIMVINRLPHVQKETQYKRISVNISPLSITDPFFIEVINRHFNNRTIDFSRICLEIVETDKLQKLNKKSIQLIKQLRKSGAWIALDDFGT